MRSGLPVSGSVKGINVEFGSRDGGTFLLARWTSSWTWNEFVTEAKENVWYTMKLSVQKTPFTISAQVLDQSGNSLGSYSASDMTNFAFEDIHYLGFGTSIGGDFSVKNISGTNITIPSTPTPSTSPTPTSSPTPTPSPTLISNLEISALPWSWLIVAAIVVVCILAFLFFNRRKKKWRLSKEKFAELVKTSSRIELADASKVTGVKMSEIKKLLSKVGMDDSATQGFFVNGDKEFVLKSTMANSVLEMGKFSFADFGSKFGFTESDAKRIITELLSEKKVSGTFTLDGKSFVTENSVTDEIGRNNG